jgi:hypothetical protein
VQARGDSRIIAAVRPSFSRLRASALVALVAVALAACADGETAVLVEVDSPDLTVPADIDTLRFEAESGLGLMASGTFAVSTDWPHSLAIRPREEGDEGAVVVRVTGLKGGVEVATTRVDAAFRVGQTVRATAVLTRCVMGNCGMDDGGFDGGLDGGADAGVDLGADDLGLEDLGADDFGVDGGDLLDAGAPDFGVDAGLPDLGFDAGRDAGFDAGADAGFDGGADVDAGVDGGADVDAGEPDAGFDGGFDAGSPDLGMPSPLLGALVISELAFGGTTTGTDEFVELHNRTGVPIDIGGVVVSYRPASAVMSYSPRATVPAGTVLAPHGFYLLGSVGYVGTVVPDQPMAWSSGFSATGGHVQITIAGAALDMLGWNTAAAAEGGMPIVGTSSDSSRSFERKAVPESTAASMVAGGADALRGNGTDTDVNAADFIVRLIRDPQNASSPPETP